MTVLDVNSSEKRNVNYGLRTITALRATRILNENRVATAQLQGVQEPQPTDGKASRSLQNQNLVWILSLTCTISF